MKMSKCMGKVVMMCDLIEEVGFDVVCYFFVMCSVDMYMDFDLDFVVFILNENFVYYV